MLFESVVMFCMFGYFLCVTAAYSADMRGPEEAPEEETKSKGSNKSGKKSEKPPSNKGDAAPAGDAPKEGE